MRVSKVHASLTLPGGLPVSQSVGPCPFTQAVAAVSMPCCCCRRCARCVVQVVQHGSQATKVLALEVTYHPACLLEAALPLLQELADKIVAVVGPPAAAGASGAPGQQGT